MSHYQELVKDIVAEPEFIYQGTRGERKAVRYATTTHLGSKYLVVVYR